MAVQAAWVRKQDAGEARMAEIANHIHEGALAFLRAEYRILAIFVVIAGALLGLVASMVETTHWFIIVAFVIGAVFSALAGNIGMRIATQANVRTTQAARSSLSEGLKVSFTGGMVMGLGVAGLAVFGLSALFILLFQTSILGVDYAGGNVESFTILLEALAGFSLGAESIALFARVGGGIYTKAADVGADLVGKVEAGIPEDDPRNPATIADNVGDNVGDVAGMGADLFGSYVATVLAAMVLGNYVIRDMGASYNYSTYGISTMLLPLVISALGIIFSIIGAQVIRVGNDGKEAEVQAALNRGNWGSILLTAIACYFLIDTMLPDQLTMEFFGEGSRTFGSIQVFYAVLVGLVVGGAISYMTEYYTGLGKKPVLDIVQKSSTGAATNIIAGLATGMISTFGPILLFAGAIWGAYEFAGFYGVAIAACAMMATTAMQLAIDAFGPIADNAGGIAEMSELPDEVRERTDLPDSVGNTTAAIGKGFAIGSAALTALALFAAFKETAGIEVIDVSAPIVMAGLFIGAMLPFLFSALAMGAVGRAAMAMIQEVRRQFRDIPALRNALEAMAKNEGKSSDEWSEEDKSQFNSAIDAAEYGKCVEISTQSALKEMIAPGMVAILTPVIVGFWGGATMLGGLLAGVTASGVLMALFQSNAGGAWDNAKKMVEEGYEINGIAHGKGSEVHKATVVGDTVGDPLKDTSGPSLNILLKLMSVVALVLAPYL